MLYSTTHIHVADMAKYFRRLMQPTHSYQQEQTAFLQRHPKPSYITWRHNVMLETVRSDNVQKLRKKTCQILLSVLVMKLQGIALWIYVSQLS